VIAFQKAQWRQIKPGDGHLTVFVSPKHLREGA
jgi:hypothetical protein